MLLYAFWPAGPAGRPALPADVWGDPCPLSALEDPDAGPFLTAVDSTTEALVFAADVSAALRAYAATVAPAGLPACPVAAARAAASLVAAETAGEWAADALDLWRCPDPDTYRDYALPHAIGETIRDGATAAGHDAAAAHFLPHVRGLVAALASPLPVLRLAVPAPALRLAA